MTPDPPVAVPMPIIQNKNSVSPANELSSGSSIKACGCVSGLEKGGTNNKTLNSGNEVFYPPDDGSGEGVRGGHMCGTPIPHPEQAWTSKARRLLFKSFCIRPLQLKFENAAHEKYYQVYARKQKIVHFVSILIFNLCFAAVLIVLSAYKYDDSKIALLIVISASLVLSISAFVAYKLKYVAEKSLVPLSYILWMLLLVQVFVKLIANSRYETHNTGDTTSWVLLLCFFTYVVLPARRLYCFLLSLGINALHMTVTLVQCHLSDTCNTNYVYRKQVSFPIKFQRL